MSLFDKIKKNVQTCCLLSEEIVFFFLIKQIEKAFLFYYVREDNIVQGNTTHTRNIVSSV